ncbi:MAG: YlmH/Sll1252 family protein [Lachnospiraceae bacterium]
MQKDELLLQKRLIELSELAYQRGIVTYSDFLNLNELNILQITPKNMLFSQYETFGGYDLSERQMVAFLPDALYYDFIYPITVLKISPLQKKFTDKLSHRDYLGAIMNLGIERNKVGDILLLENTAFLFVQETLSKYIMENLTRIKNTTIQVAIENENKFSYQPNYEEIKGTIASTRLDSLLSLAYGSSRSKLVTLIETGKVYVNGKLITTNSYQIKDHEIVSVRGIGRFSYNGIISETKKGRFYVSIYKYI